MIITSFHFYEQPLEITQTDFNREEDPFSNLILSSPGIGEVAFYGNLGRFTLTEDEETYRIIIKKQKGVT